MATGVYDPTTSYDLTVGVIVDMDEAIYLLSPIDSPMINGVDADGTMILGSRPVGQTTFNWLDDEILTPRSTLGGAIVTADTYITLATGVRTRFSTGDVLYLNKTNDESLLVTGYGTTAETLTVTRSWGAGAATTHASGDYVYQVGVALAEGSDPENARVTDRTDNSNVTQIFGPTKVRLSRTEQLIRKYGISNEFAHQLAQRTKENVISREQAFLYGEQVNDTAGKRRTTGGIFKQLTTNISTSTTLTVTFLQALQQTIYTQGGNPGLLMCHPAALADLNSIADTNIVRTSNVDSMRGRRRVTVVSTEFGDISIVRNRWMAPSDALLLNQGSISRRVMTPLRAVPLAKTGDADSMMIVAEEGLEIKGEEHMGKFNTLGY
jgi:hypothetical protein